MHTHNTSIRWWRPAVWAAGGFALGILSGRLWLAVFVALVFGGARLIGELARPAAPEPDTPPLSADMASHYQAAGLSASEVDLFRDTMDKAADQIRDFEAITGRVPKLAAIAANQDLIAVLHAYFKAIVQTPSHMAAAGHFLYEQLPNLLRIASKYETISHHEVQTADTANVLTTAANTLSDLAGAIRSDYANFVEADLDALEADVALAKKQLPHQDTIVRPVPINVEKEKVQ